MIALGLTATGSNGQASRLSEIGNSIGQELDYIQLNFAHIKDGEAFVDEFNALKDPYGSLYEAETHGSNRKSLGERGSLTRKYQSAVFDADDVIPPAKQTSANAELTPLHKAKTGQVDSSAPLSQLRRDLAGDSTNHPDGRANVFPLVAGSLGPSLESNGRNRSPDVLDADPQGATKSSVTSNEEEEMRRLRRRRICRKVVVFMLWKGEQKHGVPNELFSSPTSFDFIDGLEISQFDKIKGLFEIYSGREWDWWPFDPAAKPLESGKVRIRWQCVGDLNSIIPCASANGLRPVEINAGLMYRGTLPGSAKTWSMRIHQLGMKVAMPHLSQRAQPLVTHTLGASSQGRSPATPRNQPESPLIYIPPHKPVISRTPAKAPIQKICTFFSASTKEARSSTLKSSPPNAITMKPSSKISDKNTAA